MSEVVGEKILDLETRTSRFGKEDKSKQEIFEFKKKSNKKLQEIRRDLIGLLIELQEKLPPDPKEKCL